MARSRLAGTRSPNWAFMERFVIPHYDDPKGPPYLIRWRLIQCPLFGIYLHRLGTADPRDTLHNHPWPFISFVLRGGYTEYVPGNPKYVPGHTEYAQPIRVRYVNIKRFKNSFHWIAELDRIPTWTLMFVGRRRRVWGYLDRDGTFTNFDEHHFNTEFLLALAEQGDAA